LAELELKTRGVFLAIWPTSVLLLQELIAFPVCTFYFGVIKFSVEQYFYVIWVFAEETCDVFGIKLREQVEDRLKFYESGDIPRKNVDVMQEALAEAKTVLV